MRIYISGISGTAMGPLALMALDAGLTVCGSDRSEGAVSHELRDRKIRMEIGAQNGKFLQQCFDGEGVDWFVYTSALPKDHPELVLAKKLGIKVSKRDEFIAFLVQKLKLKMVAVAGTHGKTTTTAMIVWTCKKLGIPVSWLVGTTLGFEKAGQYTPGSEFLIYEADEYDRNFLHYFPWLAVVVTVSYDHPDIYRTEKEYKEAFTQFEKQSRNVVKNTTPVKGLKLAGKARREDAGLALKAVQEIAKASGIKVTEEEIVEILNKFPGVGRRFEKIAEGVYSDYAHHPEEIAATLDVANEEAELRGYKGVVAVYEPHQNARQHEVFSGYKDAFVGAEKIFWLPTYLTREDPNLKVIRPGEFIKSLKNFTVAEAVKLDDELLSKLQHLREEGCLILLMTAGPADGWLREKFC